jgi:beta-lysine 5,6-aminomutase alpha subunit
VEDFFKDIKHTGFMEAIAQGRFADVKRPVDGGKGLSGVFQKAADYSNPVMERIVEEGIIHE